jgi:hypothetical protein
LKTTEENQLKINDEKKRLKKISATWMDGITK